MELSQEEAELSIIPTLLETQDQFIAILSIDFTNIKRLFKVVNLSNLPANLFLKHLVVLADVGGEQLMRINSQFNRLFPSGRFRYFRNGSIQSYRFKVLPISGSLNNEKLGISGKKLIEPQPLSNLLEDVIMILMHGSACENEETAAILAKCEIGNYIGQSDALEKFVKQRYIWVSRITAGAQSNALGQIAQKFVKDYLKTNLGTPGLDIEQGSMPNIVERGNRPAKFDIVITDGSKYAAVEVSFQVTTNSVIERKAGQAQSRYEQIENSGYKIAYVIDGAGNLLQRTNAIRVLCSHSHCTVAFSRSELEVLCEFFRDYFTNSDPK
ncbi:MAG: restriction endonuclease [Euryarchaeota archaeon]|nr:restriction endonuclease [Euryarchaeota archaeon]